MIKLLNIIFIWESFIHTHMFRLSDQMKSDCICYAILQLRRYESIIKEISNQPHLSLGCCQLQTLKSYGPRENIPPVKLIAEKKEKKRFRDGKNNLTKHRSPPFEILGKASKPFSGNDTLNRTKPS